MLVHECATCGLVFGEYTHELSFKNDGAVSTSPHHFQLLSERDVYWRELMAPMIKRRIEAFTDRLKCRPKDWLEIGPGNGGLEPILLQQGIDWLGVEIDPQMAQKMKSEGKNVVLGDFAQLNPSTLMSDTTKQKGGYDVVFFSQVFEHVISPAKFLKNAFDCLRPGGLVYVDVPNNDGLTAAIRRMNALSSGFGEIVPPHHMIAYGKSTLRKALLSAGFEQADVFAKHYNDLDYGLVHAQMDQRLKLRVVWKASKILNMGGNLVGIATKPE